MEMLQRDALTKDEAKRVAKAILKGQFDPVKYAAALKKRGII
jgi:anthranilate phosphoribosyltransferase